MAAFDRKYSSSFNDFVVRCTKSLINMMAKLYIFRQDKRVPPSHKCCFHILKGELFYFTN